MPNLKNKTKNILHNLACWTIPGYHYLFECKCLYTDIERLIDLIRNDIRKEYKKHIHDVDISQKLSPTGRYERKIHSIKIFKDTSRQLEEIENEVYYNTSHPILLCDRKQLRVLHSHLSNMLETRVLNKIQKGY